jgi:hypothetical protein
MSLGFVQLINRIEAEIHVAYIPEAIRWCDEKFNNAWSNAIDRFDKALSVAIERQDYRLAELEGDYYKVTILELLGRFKASHDMDAQQSFLSALRGSHG